VPPAVRGVEVTLVAWLLLRLCRRCLQLLRVGARQVVQLPYVLLLVALVVRALCVAAAVCGPRRSAAGPPLLLPAAAACAVPVAAAACVIFITAASRVHRGSMVEPSEKGRRRRLSVAAAVDVVVVQGPAGAPGQLPATQETQRCHRTPQQAAGALHVEIRGTGRPARFDGGPGMQRGNKRLHAREAARHSTTPTCRLLAMAQAGNMACFSAQQKLLNFAELLRTC
jgi:hypothetical protein